MDPNISKILDREALWINIVLYFMSSMLLVLAFSYFMLIVKENVLTENINRLDAQIADQDSQLADFDQKVLDYRKKVNDYSLVIGSHKITTDVFLFVEKTTLPSIWFSNFDMSQKSGELRLTGQAPDMETFSRQVQIFENNTTVKNINVLDSRIEDQGKVRFLLSLSLDPEKFNFISKTP